MDADSKFPAEPRHDSRQSIAAPTIRASAKDVTTCFTIKPNTFRAILTAQERVSAAEICRPHIYRSRAESYL
ncbi:hypothetical protein HISP_00725 [Haloarcula hispanica N601]|uniref:Uncharacterized protein n=1 Tax=Haloarcula hispanica N601 TaxID=1417673 RepID=V5TQM0_HALHI|nr:hypothetical protein HISP_00725 [Haloarcula hispanica N601]AJF25779.1 hypothetical protein SG26_08585 [Haloarcula sp. CBA1115]